MIFRKFSDVSNDHMNVWHNYTKDILTADTVLKVSVLPMISLCSWTLAAASLADFANYKSRSSVSTQDFTGYVSTVIHGCISFMGLYKNFEFDV